MKLRRLGRSGPMVAEIGLGCMSWAGFYGPADDAESRRVMARALDLGVNHWDTANVYGNGSNETLLGSFFAEDRTRRDRVVLASKFGIIRGPNGERTFDNRPSHMIECLEASLRRLKTDRLDLYYIHRVEPGRPVEETVAALARQVQAGKIRAIGLSEVAPDTLRRAAAVHPIAAVQSEYSLWTRTPEVGLIQACREVGAAFVAFGALGRGFLSGALTDIATLAEKDFRRGNPRFVEPNWSRNRAAYARFAALAEARGTTTARLALAWVLAQGDHIIPIPGTRSIAHLEENVAAADLSLTASDLAAIEAVLPKGFAAGDRYTDLQWYGSERYA
jgi:aryl-alcohol dehydrogenase-like predicted oxidoreductase